MVVMLRAFGVGLNKFYLLRVRICFRSSVKFNCHSGRDGIKASRPGTLWSDPKSNGGFFAATLLFQKPCLFYSDTDQPGYISSSVIRWFFGGVAIMVLLIVILIIVIAAAISFYITPESGSLS